MKDNISCLAAPSIKRSAIGIGYSSFGVAKFKFLKSTHTLILPFFFLTGTALETHSTYLAGLINLACNNRSISSFISICTSAEHRRGACL
ncbi:hypothetical protein RchiOBHm_Chr6g0263221 [Rosa chinensis]|uniref:Uncharacterized protein n=1 Tax=Rosa chinensis TaxID=74649 RepID=A0A2P6PNV7_ROSCH|nr:hypothetical protein RchiOBHm_Chr6g0263221 [Rosa chinensis]